MAPRSGAQAKVAAGEPQLQAFKGVVQTAPVVYIDYWGWTSDPSGEKPYLENFLSSIGGTPWVKSVLQYGAGAPADLLKGTWSSTTAIPATPTYDDIRAEADRAAQHFGVADDLNVQIIVATPTGHSSGGFGISYCGYHGTIGLGAMPQVTYTNLPYNTDKSNCGTNVVNPGASGLLDGVSMVAGHELVESITDPLLNSWSDSNSQENADKCSWKNPQGNVTTSAGTFAVQSLWSNTTASCVLSTVPPSSPPASPTKNIRNDDGNGNETVYGTVDLGGSPGFGWIEYGTTTAYGSTVGFDPIASANTTPYQYQATGLTPGTTYHFRVHLANEAGLIASSDATFVPTGFGSANAIALSGTGNESVIGTVHLEPGTSATATLSYGTSASYGSTATVNVTANASGVAYASFYRPGLNAATTYHYKIDVSGSVHFGSGDLTFTTS
ncbi:fibronectin type III domain-containing protein [Actinomadura rubteroloni]|nr:fibronectin type III domain-containing protein [Actinomadura rubteroloni]